VRTRRESEGEVRRKAYPGVRELLSRGDGGGSGLFLFYTAALADADVVLTIFGVFPTYFDHADARRAGEDGADSPSLQETDGATSTAFGGSTGERALPGEDT